MNYQFFSLFQASNINMKQQNKNYADNDINIHNRNQNNVNHIPL